MARKRWAKELDEKTTRLLTGHGLLAEPVDVEALARQLGATVRRDELEDDVSGFLLVEHGVSTITVNSRHHMNRQRFTIAHECGHLHLHAGAGDRLWVDKTHFYRATSKPGEDLQEIQANQFAAGILLPEHLVRTSLNGRTPLTEVDISRLASRFEVSDRAMTVRLISIELIPSVTS
jgi:Zn-dependent peptidase ImmA (M78 family)